MIIIFVSIFFVEAITPLSFLEQAGVLILDIRTNTPLLTQNELFPESRETLL